MSFHFGQLVVCVDISGDPMSGIRPRYGWIQSGLDGLQLGRIYTVRDCGILQPEGFPTLVQVRLAEITRSIEWDGLEAGFIASRFRPVDETRIAVFRKALTSSPVGEEVA